MASTSPIDVKFDPEAMRLFMEIPRAIVEGIVPLPEGHGINHLMLVKRAEHIAKALKAVLSGLTPINDPDALDQIRDEVNDFEKWAESKIDLLDADKK